MSDMGGAFGDPGADGADGFWSYFDAADATLDGFDTIESSEYQVNSIASDLDALIDAGFDTDGAGARLGDSEIAPFLDTGQAEVSEAGHEFRGDAQGELGLPNYRG